MSVVPKSSSENSEQRKAPSVPQKTRGLFPRDDGWYDVDENGGEKKLATMDDIPNDNNPSIIKDISISKSEDYTNLSIEKKDGTTLNEEFYNKDQANTKFAIKSDIPDVTALTKELANIEEKKVGISDIVDDLNTYDSSKPLSANMGALLYSSIPDLVSQAATGLNLMDYNAVDNLIYNHNVDSTNHSDIRYEIQQIADRLTSFLDTDDTTLDQVSEIVAYINSNKELIDAITTSKVNVVDIVDNLQTSSSDRPLSANQGVQLMSMLNNLALDLYGFLDNTSDGNMYPLSNLIQQVYNKLDYTTVVDNLYTYDSYVPLSANMGNYLEVNKINYTDIVDDVCIADSYKPLSANAGYNLNMDKISYSDIIDSFDNIPMYNAGGSYNPLSARLGYELYQGKIGFDSLVTDPTYMVVEDNYSVLSAYYGKQLYDYITLVAQNIPSSMSQLYDDVGYVMDTDYTHTDNNFTDEYKEKLDNLGDNPGGSGSSGITHSWNGTVLTITSDSGTSSVDLKGDKGDTPNVVFHYDEETGELSYKVDDNFIFLGNLKDKERVWTKLGAVRLGGTMEQLASYDAETGNVTFANGFVPTSGRSYVLSNDAGTKSLGICRFTLVEEGVYTMTDLDSKVLTGKSYDLTTTYVQNPEARVLIIQNFDAYDQYKVRVSAPLFVTHGARNSFIFGKTASVTAPWSCLAPYGAIYPLSGFNVVYECETYSAECSEKPNLRYSKQLAIGTKSTDASSTGGHSRYNAIKLAEYDFSPDNLKVDGVNTIRLHHWNDILTIGTYFELWGRNDE